MDKVTARDLEEICDVLAEELERLSGARLLITGGAGFLGYYLVQTPLFWNQRNGSRDQIKVTVLDNYPRGVPRWMDEWASSQELEVVRHDVTQPLPPAAGTADYFIHAASIASPTFYRRHPIQTMDANVSGLRHVLDHCLGRPEGQRPRGVLFFSSSEIYGDPSPDQIPTSEEYRGLVSSIGPRACYDESKRFGETLCWNFARHYGVPVTMVRPFNNYGPGLALSDRRVIPDLARDVLEGRDVALLSDGAATRTFCYVADAVAGYFKVLTRGRPGEAYNIGTESPEVTISELAHRFVTHARAMRGYSGAIVHRTSPDPDYTVNNPVRRCPSIQKARRELGYEPAVTLDEGLRRTLTWYTHEQQR
jgi:UDP-glucuronate decarboxylase